MKHCQDRKKSIRTEERKEWKRDIYREREGRLKQQDQDRKQKTIGTEEKSESYREREGKIVKQDKDKKENIGEEERKNSEREPNLEWYQNSLPLNKKKG